jgi:hypothetical protein
MRASIGYAIGELEFNASGTNLPTCMRHALHRRRGHTLRRHQRTSRDRRLRAAGPRHNVLVSAPLLDFTPRAT